MSYLVRTRYCYRDIIDKCVYMYVHAYSFWHNRHNTIMMRPINQLPIIRIPHWRSICIADHMNHPSACFSSPNYTLPRTYM